MCVTSFTTQCAAGVTNAVMQEAFFLEGGRDPEIITRELCKETVLLVYFFYINPSSVE